MGNFEYNPITNKLDKVKSLGVLDARYLKLDQTSPQTVSGGAPIFSANIDLDGSYVDNVASIYGTTALNLYPHTGVSTVGLIFDLYNPGTGFQPIIQVDGLSGNLCFEQTGAFVDVCGLNIYTNSKAEWFKFGSNSAGTPYQYIQTTDDFRLYTSGDVDDYIIFKTVGDVPEMTTAGSTNLKITADGGTIDFDDDNLTTTGSVGIGVAVAARVRLFAKTTIDDAASSYGVIESQIQIDGDSPNVTHSSLKSVLISNPGGGESQGTAPSFLSSQTNQVYIQGSGTIGTLCNIDARMFAITSSSDVTDLIAFCVLNPFIYQYTGTIDNIYGLKIESLKETEITNAWGIYQEGVNDKNYFAGPIYTPIIYGMSSTYLRIGDAGTTAYSFSSEDDLMVTGNFEVKGTGYYTGVSNYYGRTAYRDLVAATFGNSTDASWQWYSGGTNHFLQLATRVGAAATSGYVFIVDYDSKDDVDRRPAGTVADPTLRIYSADGTQADDYIEFYHDQDDAVIDWGNGDLYLAGGNVGIGTASPSETLEVAGNIAVTGVAGDDVYIFKNAGSGIRIRSDTLTTQWWAQDDGPAYFGTITNDDLHIQTYNNTRITILSGAGSGYVGIGETSPQDRLEVNGAVIIKDKLKLTQDDGNEYIDSLNDGYLDLGATTGIRINNYVRHTSTNYRRYYHLSVGGFDPGASGATWINPGGNHTGGWRLNADTEVLIAGTDIHSDWDGASDITAEIRFVLNAAGVGDNVVDLQMVAYYNGIGDTSTKTQTVAVNTTTDGTQYKEYKATFILDYDAGGNVIDAGDEITFILNLLDTSDPYDVIITGGTFFYNTTHIGIESGDT